MPGSSNPEVSLGFLLARWPQPLDGCTASVRHWGKLLGHAQRHGVLGILRQPLLDCGRLPQFAREQLRHCRDLEQLWHAHLGETQTVVLAALGDAGLRAVVLKGPVLAERLYGDAAMRLSTDVDILVGPGEVAAAVAALERLGYVAESGKTARYHREFHHHWCLQHSRRPPVELHFRLYVGFGVQLAAEAFLARALPYRTQRGESCYILSPEDEFLYLCLHAAGHDFVRLAWLVDLKTFLLRHPGLDPALVRSRAAEHGVASALAFTGIVLRERLGVSEPRLFATPRSFHLARRLLACREPFPEASRTGKFLGLLLQASLSDHAAAGGWLLCHHLGRSAKRFVHRQWPARLPAEWGA